MAEGRHPVMSYLEALKCGSQMFPNDFHNIISIQEDATFPQLFKTLIDNKILAVPVVDANGKALSLISMVDLLGEFVEAFSEKELKGLETTKTWEYFFHLSELKERKQSIDEEIVSQLVQKTVSGISQDPVTTVKDEESVLQAAKQMIAHNAHRVLTIDSSQKLCNVITLSRLMELLGKILSSIPESKKSIEELNLGLKEVITMEEHKMAVKAFKLMKDNRISSVGVVNDEQELVGTITVNDLKLLGYDLKYFEFLHASLKDYMEMVKKSDKLKHTDSIRSKELKGQVSGSNQVIVMSKKDTLASVIESMNRLHIHHVFVVQDRKPIGVISQLDVLKAVLAPRIAE